MAPEQRSGRGEPRDALIERQALLLEVGILLSSELSLPAVLQRIIDLAALVTGAKYGALGVLGPDDRITEFVTTGITNEERERVGNLPVGVGILGVLIKEPRPLRLANIADDPRSVGFPPNHPPMRSFLGAPIQTRGRVFGNVYLTEKQGAAEFSDEDEQAIVVLASQAAIAIENARLYEDAVHRQAVLEALREVTVAILEGSDAGEALQLTVSRARELVDADAATLAVRAEDDPEVLEVRISAGHGAAEMRGRRFPIDGSISGAVIRSGRPELIADLAADERVHQPFVRAGGFGPGMFVPLAGPGAGGATLAIANRSGARPFRWSDVEMVETFAEQAAVAMRYGRALEELRRLTVVADRERIAKDIHDGAIQSLFAVGMSLQATAAMVGDTAASQRIRRAVDDLDGVIRDLREYIFELRPAVLAGRHVHDALRQLAAEVEDRTDLVLVLELDPAVSVKLATHGHAVVQLVREALSNVTRHAKAQTCRVTLRGQGASALIEIDDDGIGFDPSAVTGSGQGLRNLHERAVELGGDLEVASTPGEGTTVRIRLPVES